MIILISIWAISSDFSTLGEFFSNKNRLEFERFRPAKWNQANNANPDIFADTKMTSLYDTLLNNVSSKVCCMHTCMQHDCLFIYPWNENCVQDIPKASFEAMTASISGKTRLQKIEAYSRFVKHLRKDTITIWYYTPLTMTHVLWVIEYGPYYMVHITWLEWVCYLNKFI